MTTAEGAVKAKAKRILDTEGVYYFFPATHGFGRSGVPDIVACVDGRFVGIECKAQGKQPTALQSRELDRIRAARGVALVINEDNVAELGRFLKLIREPV